MNFLDLITCIPPPPAPEVKELSANQFVFSTAPTFCQTQDILSSFLHMSNQLHFAFHRRHMHAETTVLTETK